MAVKMCKIPELPHDPLVINEKEFAKWDSAMLDHLLHTADARHLWPYTCKQPKHDPFSWTSLGTRGGVVMDQSTLSGDSKVHCLRGVAARVPLPVATVAHTLRQMDNMPLMNPLCNLTREVMKYDSDHSVMYSQIALGKRPLVSDRDFVCFSAHFNLPSGAYAVCGKSVITDKCPNDRSHVRGEIKVIGFVVEAVKGHPEESSVTYVMQSDPKGWLPSALVNRVAAVQAYMPGVLIEKADLWRRRMADPSHAPSAEDLQHSAKRSWEHPTVDDPDEQPPADHKTEPVSPAHAAAASATAAPRPAILAGAVLAAK